MKKEKQIRDRIRVLEQEAIQHYLYGRGDKSIYSSDFKKVLISKIEMLKWVLDELEDVIPPKKRGEKV